MNDEMRTRCEEATRKVCEAFDVELKGFNGDADHVHLVHYPPKVALASLVNSPKGVCSRRLRGVHRPG